MGQASRAPARTRRWFLASLPAACFAVDTGRGRLVPSAVTRYPDPTTEFPVYRLTDPAHTSHLPSFFARAISRRSNSLVYASDISGRFEAAGNIGGVHERIAAPRDRAREKGWQMTGVRRISEAIDGKLCGGIRIAGDSRRDKPSSSSVYREASRRQRGEKPAPRTRRSAARLAHSWMISPVAGLVMLAEQIQSEITFKIAPDAVNMIRVVLSVIVLDQKQRRLDAVVVRVAALDAAGPREIKIVLALVKLLKPGLGHWSGEGVRVLRDQLAEDLLLLRGQFGIGQPARLSSESRLARRGRDDVGIGFLIDDRRGPLVFGQRLNQRAPQVLFALQRAQAGTRSFAHFGGVGAEEIGARRNSSVHNGEVQADVVPLHAIDPGARLRWLAEDAEVIFLRITLDRKSTRPNSSHRT